MSETAPSPDPIDRLAPARRPDRVAVMSQLWRSLLFLHWELPPEQVRSFLPPGLDLDLFDGKAYVSLLPFTMRAVRPTGLPPLPWLSYFHETNVRTYVHVGGRDPGIWFFSLEAANPVAVYLARSLFHLPYHHARMSLDARPVVDSGEASGTEITYRSERLRPGPRPATHAITARVPRAATTRAEVGTLDHFLIERYFLYTSNRQRLYRGQVHHHPYPIQSAEVLELDESLLSASGLVRPPDPPLTHFSPGVDVKIFSLQTVPKF